MLKLTELGTPGRTDPGCGAKWLEPNWAGAHYPWWQMVISYQLSHITTTYKQRTTIKNHDDFYVRVGTPQKSCEQLKL